MNLPTNPGVRAPRDLPPTRPDAGAGSRPAIAILCLSALLVAPAALAQSLSGPNGQANNDPDYSSPATGSPLPETPPAPLPETSPAPLPDTSPESPPAGPGAPTIFRQSLEAVNINARLTGTAIVDTCVTTANRRGAANNQRFQDDCDLIVGGVTIDPTGSAQAVTDLAADQINAQNSVATRTAGLGVAMVRSRLAARQGGGASADAGFGRFDAYLTTRYVTGDADQTELQPGYDFDGWSILGGIDYRFSDQLIGGIGLNWSNGNADYDLNRGKMDSDSLGVSVYGAYNMDNGVFIDGVIGYNQTDFTLERRINYTIGPDTATQVARSDPEADVWNVNLGAGYTYYQDAWSITPSLRLNYVENQVDGYSERMSNPTAVGGSMALAIDSQTYTSFTSDLGVQVARAISLPSGVLVPQLRIGWVHEFEDGGERVGARFVNDINNTPLAILTEGGATDYADVTAGLSAQFANGRSAFLAYNGLFGYDDASYHAISAGVRLEF